MPAAPSPSGQDVEYIDHGEEESVHQLRLRQGGAEVVSASDEDGELTGLIGGAELGLVRFLWAPVSKIIRRLRYGPKVALSLIWKHAPIIILGEPTPTSPALKLSVIAGKK